MISSPLRLLGDFILFYSLDAMPSSQATKPQSHKAQHAEHRSESQGVSNFASLW